MKITHRLVRCGFSFDTDVQRDVNNPYLTRYHDLLSVDTRQLLFAKLATALPALGGFILRMFMRLFMFLHKLKAIFPSVRFPEMPLLWLLDHIGEHVISVRKEKNTTGRVDILHIMLDAATDQNIVVSNYSEHMTFCISVARMKRVSAMGLRPYQTGLLPLRN